jgi:2-amino-4-hydroxy-6-hydroxymethyldihydropteridine diphosphokinase
MILIGLGANLDTKKFGPPRAALGAALQEIEKSGMRIKQRSSWYQTAPVPASKQPWYVNSVAELETYLSPKAIICALLKLEKCFGRVRTVPNAPRILDLDLLAYNDLIIKGSTPKDLTVPHPRVNGRSFVIIPLLEIAPNWRDPVSGKTIANIAYQLPKGQQTHKMKDEKGVFGSEWLTT